MNLYSVQTIRRVEYSAYMSCEEDVSNFLTDEVISDVSTRMWEGWALIFLGPI